MEENYQNPNQPQFQNQNYNNNFPQQIQVPNASTVLVLGILSIVFCCVAGIVLGIIALNMYSKANKTYQANPSIYTSGSYSNLTAGRVCAIIGLILTSLVTLYYIFIFLIYGALLSALPWDRF